MISTGNVGLDAFADAIADRVEARLRKSKEARLLTVKEAAAYIGHTEKSLRHMMAAGAIPVVQDRRRVYLDRADIDRWIEFRKEKR